MLDKIHQVNSFSFTAKVSIMTPSVNDNPPYLTLGQAFAVKAQRPAALRIEEVELDAPNADMICGTPFNFFASDGQKQYIMAKESLSYISGVAAAELKDIDDAQGLLSFLGLDILLNPDSLAFQQAPDELLNNKTVYVFVRTQSDQGRSQQQSLYIDGASQLPMQLSEFYTDETYSLLETVRVEYQEWKLNPVFDNETFDTTLPTGAQPAYFE